MPVRALFSSLLVAVLLSVGIASPAAAAKNPVATIALGVKKQAAKPKKSAKKKKAPAKKKKAPAKKKKRKSAAAKTSVATRTSAPAAPVTCTNTDIQADAANIALYHAAIVCLHDQIRQQSNLGTLAYNGALATAALGKSNDMVDRGYFTHDTPEGDTFVDRILAARYAPADGGWTLGENLAWGTGDRSTPAAIMEAWMNSPGHRANILKGAYREIGVGVRLGTPTGNSFGVTITAEFGARL